MSMFVSVYLCVYICNHTYIHTYIHTYLHTYIHTYIHIQAMIHIDYDTHRCEVEIVENAVQPDGRLLIEVAARRSLALHICTHH